MTDIFPQRNLPDQAEAWGRDIEDRIKGIEKKVSVVANTTRNTNLVAVKSAEAADHNVRRVEIQVEALEAAVNEKTRAVLDEAIEELREAEIVLESQFEAHDTALGEAETAIGTLETDLADAETAIGSLELDLAPGGGTYDRITDALVQAGDAQGTANAAQTAASTAQETADQAAQDAATAQTAASNAATAASTAQDAADQAAQDAANAAGIAASKGDVLIQEMAPATAMRKATTLWIDTTGGKNTPKRWNGSKWVAVTDKAAVDAAAAAATAQSTANAAQTAADLAASAAADAQDTADQAIQDAAAAQTAAGNAQTTANAAQTAAAGKSAIYYSTEAPSGTGTKQGDIWFRRDAQGSTLGMWEWTGSSWQSRTLRNEVIANLDAGKITTGHLSADRLNARSITGDKLVLGSSENLIPNGSGEFGDLGGWASFTNMTGVSWETDDAPPGLPGYVRFDKTGRRESAGVGGLFDVEPGAEYLFEAYIRADVAGSRLFVECRDDKNVVATNNFAIPGYPSGNGTGTGNPGGYLIQNREVPTTWTRIVGRTVVGSGINKIRIRAVYANHPNGTVTDAVVDIAGLRLQKRASAELIVDGAVTADKVAANAITSEKVAARSITAEKLVISPANVWPDPYFVETGAWRGTDVAMVADPDMPGGNGVRITTRAAGQRGTYYRGMSSGFVQVEPGAQYRFRATVKQEGGPDPSRLSVYIRGYTADGTMRLSSKVIVPGDVEPGTFTVDEALPAIAGDVHGGVTVGVNTSGPIHEGKVFTVGGASLTRMADSSLIVNGAVTAEKVQAQSVAGAVGVFIDAMMQNLSVTGVANIHQVVADELYTKMAVVQKLQATESIVTKDMIATGAITSEKLAAGAVTADIVDVGQNAKWDSNGLMFYAPPFPDQAYDDWENRTPIISLTPAGDVSVTVAQGGQPTAGMEATGLVHGDRGEFNSLTVGGESLDDLLNRQGGIISAHRLAETVQTTHSEVRLLTIPVLIMPGRQYEIQFQLAASGAAGLWARIRQSASGVPTTGNSLQREHLWQIGDGQKVVQFSHFISENETTSNVPPEGLLVNVGLFAAGNSAVTMNYFGSGWGGKPRTYAILKEIGPLIEWDVQQVSAPNPPKKNYSGSVKATGWWRGFAQDGRHTVDTRATVAGRYYGTDMHEHVVVEVSNMQTTLSGAEVTGGSVTVRQSSSSGGFGDVRWNIGFVGTARPGSFTGVTYFATNVNFPKGVAVKVSIPAAHRDKLRTGAFKSIVISPTHGASLSSYGYVDILATKVDFTYRK